MKRFWLRLCCTKFYAFFAVKNAPEKTYLAHLVLTDQSVFARKSMGRARFPIRLPVRVRNPGWEQADARAEEIKVLVEKANEAPRDRMFPHSVRGQGT